MRGILNVFILVFVVLAFLCGISEAFLYEINILNKEAIKSLSDEALIDAYIDVIVELEAARTFHQTSGFGKKSEYEKYKKILRYRTYLIMEINNRELKVPAMSY